MLWVSTEILEFKRFRDTFRSANEECDFIDLSGIPTHDLIDNCESILSHHKKSCIFLGFLEPGWMMDVMHQTRMRSVFRSRHVAFVCNHVESIPYSWKNGIEFLYVSKPNLENGDPQSVHDGSSV
jgi:hypothetical protein